MESTTPINPDEFVATLRPYLHRKDLSGLVARIQSRWRGPQIADLFDCSCCDARATAALAYGMVGGPCCLERLVPLLKDSNPVVAQMADHALWNVWFRLGTPDANHQLCRGTKALNRGDIEHAIHHFDRALHADPSFAEAYNQRAIAKFLLEQFDDSIVDCRKCIQLMPFHYGALAGLGHCHAHEGRLVPALKSYEKAIAINPRLDDVRQAIQELRERFCPIDDCDP